MEVIQQPTLEPYYSNSDLNRDEFIEDPNTLAHRGVTRFILNWHQEAENNSTPDNPSYFSQHLGYFSDLLTFTDYLVAKRYDPVIIKSILGEIKNDPGSLYKTIDQICLLDQEKTYQPDPLEGLSAIFDQDIDIIPESTTKSVFDFEEEVAEPLDDTKIISEPEIKEDFLKSKSEYFVPGNGLPEPVTEAQVKLRTLGESLDKKRARIARFIGLKKSLSDSEAMEKVRFKVEHLEDRLANKGITVPYKSEL